MIEAMLGLTVTDLVAGPNLPFVGVFAGALLLTVLSVMGLGSELHGDAELGADHDVDADADVGLDHDLDLDADAEVGDVENDVELHGAEASGVHAGHDVATSALSLSNLLYFFGIGRVPISMLLVSFGYAFGTVGWMANMLLQARGEDPSRWFAVSLLAALIAGLLAMRLVGTIVGRYLPTSGVSGFARKQLVGLRGSTSLPVSEQGGQVHVVDAEGTLHQLCCRVAAGAEALPKSTPVILVKYVPEKDFYYVVFDRKRR